MTTPTNDHAIRFPRTAIIWIVCGSLVFSLLLFSALTLILLKILDNEEIHFAAEQGDVQGIERILDRNPARLESRDRLDRTPLLCAAWSGQVDALKVLIRRGADVNAFWNLAATGDGEWTALHNTANGGYLDATSVLIRVGVNINGKTLKGETPLDIAIRRGDTKMVDLLKINGGVRGQEK